MFQLAAPKWCGGQRWIAAQEKNPACLHRKLPDFEHRKCEDLFRRLLVCATKTYTNRVFFCLNREYHNICWVCKSLGGISSMNQGKAIHPSLQHHLNTHLFMLNNNNDDNNPPPQGLVTKSKYYSPKLPIAVKSSGKCENKRLTK